jgi:hypothetical protein
MQEKRRAAGYKQLALISDYQQTFGTPHGKNVIRHLMKVHGVLDKSFVEGKADATAFNEGGRNAVLMILKKLRIDIKKLEQILLEETKLEEDSDANY